MRSTIIRGGTYYYVRRIPTDLVEARAFGLTKQGNPVEVIKHSLKTKDPREARRRVSIEDIRAEEQFERKRQELEADAPGGRVADAGEVRRRPLASLSGPERRDLALRWFIEMERAAREGNARDPGALDQDEAETWLSEAAIDLSVLEGSSDTYGPAPDWEPVLTKRLHEAGIEPGEQDSEAFRELCDLLKRAYVERAWRTHEALRGRPQSERDRAFRGQGAESEMPRGAAKSEKTVGLLCDSFLEGKDKAGVAPGTLAKYGPQLKALRDFFGEDRALRSITVEDGQRFADFLAKVPVNAAKRYPGMNLATASKQEAKRKAPRFLSPKTQGDVFNAAVSVFLHAMELEWIESNPLGKKAVRSRLPRVEKQDKPMMSAAELSALFASPTFRDERQDASNPERGQARFWVPLLCLFHGFRANEVCQLLVCDVKQEDGIDFLSLRETDDEGNRVKRFKTRASRRKVPIHRELIRMGFLEFVEGRRSAGGEFLFAGLKPNRLGSKADPIGKWFARTRKEVVGELPDVQGAKGLHSFRHSFVRACRDAGIPEEIRKALGGWGDGARESSEAIYGRGFGLKRLKVSIDKVEFPGVDLGPLYPSADQ